MKICYCIISSKTEKDKKTTTFWAAALGKRPWKQSLESVENKDK